MDPSEYRTIYTVEDRHWWYTGMRSITLALLAEAYGERADLDILDAGSGTGAALGYLARFGRVTGIDYPAGTADVAFTYDALGNRSTMTDGTGVTSWTLDALNRPLTITAPSGAVGYGYDRLGNRTTLRYPDTKSVTYTVDALSRIASVQD